MLPGPGDGTVDPAKRCRRKWYGGVYHCMTQHLSDASTRAHEGAHIQQFASVRASLVRELLRCLAMVLSGRSIVRQSESSHNMMFEQRGPQESISLRVSTCSVPRRCMLIMSRRQAAPVGGSPAGRATTLRNIREARRRAGECEGACIQSLARVRALPRVIH